MLDHGADIHAKSKHGYTSLMGAKSKRIKQLLEAKIGEMKIEEDIERGREKERREKEREP